MDTFETWMHDDITLCIVDECPHTECERNIANRLSKGGYYSAADFRKSCMCPLEGEEKCLQENK